MSYIRRGAVCFCDPVFHQGNFDLPRPPPYYAPPYERRQIFYCSARTRAARRYALDRFSRVGGFLEVPPEKLEASPNIEIELRFSQDAEGHYKLNGIVGFPAHCKCHRCLEPIDLLLEVELDAVLAFDEKEATSLGEMHEVIHLSREDISVVDLIEDDLLLSIPKDVCELGERCENAPRTQYASDSDIDEKDFESRNPFAVLADLKKN